MNYSDTNKTVTFNSSHIFSADNVESLNSVNIAHLMMFNFQQKTAQIFALCSHFLPSWSVNKELLCTWGKCFEQTFTTDDFQPNIYWIGHFTLL